MMRKLLSIAVASLFLITGESFAYNLKITCRAKGIELVLLQEAIDEWVRKTHNKHNVEVVTLPHSSNECFALYKQWLSAESFDIDILQMDFPWIGAFADYLADLRPLIDVKVLCEKDIFPAVLKNMYDGDRLVALPVYTDCEIMYYRKDLLDKYGFSVPKTWEELYQTALSIQRKEQRTNNRFIGYVFQAKAFEMLTCNFVQLVDSFGGSIVKDGRADINSQQCVDALSFMIDCLKNISTQSVLNYSEEEARGLFQAGNALFMNTWPYAWSLMNDPSTAVSGKIGVLVIPRRDKNSGKPSGALGGWFFTVSKYSKHAKEAADLAQFLTSKEQHLARMKHTYAPAYRDLYDNNDILFSTLKNALENAVARPSSTFGKTYPRASIEICNLVNMALTESLEDERRNITERFLRRLNKRLNNILRRNNRTAHPDQNEPFLRRVILGLKQLFVGFFRVLGYTG